MSVRWRGLKEFQAAIKRHPQKVLTEGRNFITRGLAIYNRGILNSPWRIGGFGGGAPVSNDPRYSRPGQRQRSGNLRDTHMRKVEGLRGFIGPDLRKAPYAGYVHEGTGKMEARPWLDYVKRTKNSEIRSLQRRFLGKISADLAK